jgi:hypothetical protein
VSTKKGGWGVGLSLARRIVEDVHGGRLFLAPAERGATFVMVLPAAERAAAEADKGPGLGLAARIGLPWGAKPDGGAEEPSPPRPPSPETAGGGG